VFGAGEHAAGRNPGPQTVASERIQLIMQYLETIQEKQRLRRDQSALAGIT
jgi:hypothetical protein